ncbi:hypothetical protein LP419_05770 [Massilia sp. H-1]|nr:hypothetical protein LP419_05770 [Massilia sp. H-1]
MLAQRTGQCQGLSTKDPDVLNFYIGVGGNHVWIRSDDGVYALHAHMIPGSISSSICPKNATKFTNPSSSGWIAPEAAVTNGVHITHRPVPGSGRQQRQFDRSTLARAHGQE